MKKQRRKHTAEFKARAALEAIRGVKTINEIATEFEIYPVMVGNWKKEMLDKLPRLFEQKNPRKEKERDKETEHLHRKVGQLTMEMEFLEKKCKQLRIPVKGPIHREGIPTEHPVPMQNPYDSAVGGVL